MSNTARLAKLQGSIRERLRAEAERLQNEFYATVSDEELRAYVAVWQWLQGYTHAPRPLPAVLAQAFAFRDKLPHELIEAYRRVLKAEGNLPNEYEEVVEDLLGKRRNHDRKN